MDYAISKKSIYCSSLIEQWVGRISYAVNKLLFSAESDAFSQRDIRQTEQIKGLDVEDVLDQYGNAILRLAYSYLHNMSDAEDILQETLIKYMEAAQSFESAEHKKAWLLRVAANLSKNRIDYNRVREADELEETLALEEKEDLSFIWDAVKKLPEKYREVIHLFYQEGYQTKEISEILGRNESTIRSDLKRGRERLKEVLKEEYDFEI